MGHHWHQMAVESHYRAERKTGRPMPIETLSWHDVFEADYYLPEEGA